MMSEAGASGTNVMAWRAVSESCRRNFWSKRPCHGAGVSGTNIAINMVAKGGCVGGAIGVRDHVKG